MRALGRFPFPRPLLRPEETPTFNEYCARPLFARCSYLIPPPLLSVLTSFISPLRHCFTFKDRTARESEDVAVSSVLDALRYPEASLFVKKLIRIVSTGEARSFCLVEALEGTEIIVS